MTGTLERMAEAVRPRPDGTPRRARILLLLGLGLVAAYGLSGAMVVVEPGQVAVPVRFGSVQPEALAEGPHLTDPVTRFVPMTVRRQIMEMSSGGGARQANAGAELSALSSEQLPLSIDIGFPYALNPASAAQVYRRIGGDRSIDDLMRPAARTAVRDAVAQFGWEDATVHRRQELAEAITQRFRELVTADLRGLGLSEAEAKAAFALPPVVVRRVMPPPSVQEAAADRVRAKQELEKQATLTDIARQEAERRNLEAQGIANLIRGLPEGYGPEHVAALLNALANRTRAEAMAQATRQPGVQMVVMEGGAGGAVPPAQPAR